MNTNIFNCIEIFLVDSLEKISNKESLNETELKIQEYFKDFYKDEEYTGSFNSVITEATLGIYNIVIGIHPPFKDKNIKLVSNKTINIATDI